MGYDTGLGPTKLIPTGAMTSTNKIYSQAFNVIPFQSAAFQPIWTGTPTGTFAIEVSLDYVPNLQNADAPINAGTWNDLGASVSPNPTGSAGSTYIPAYGHAAPYIRLRYINDSGDGVLKGNFFGKIR